MPKNEKLVLLQKALILLLANSFIYVSNSAYGPFIGAYYAQKGIPVSQIGILLAIGPITAVLVQPLWAGISDRSGQRKRVLLSVVAGASLSMLCYYLGSSFWAYFAATALLMAFTTSVGPLCDTLVVHESRMLHLNFAHIRLGGTIGYSISVLIMGIVFRNSPGAIFTCASVFYAAMFFFVLRLPPDPTAPAKRVKKAADAADDAQEEAGRGLFGVFANREIIFVLLFALSFQIGMSFYGSFLGVYLQSLGEDSYIGIANMIAAASEIPVLLLIDRIRRKLGTMPILVGCCLMVALRTFVLTNGSLGLVFAMQALQGITYIPVYFCCVMFICDSVLHGKQSQGQSFLAITQAGVGSIIGNIGGGQLVEYLGLQSAYHVVSLVTLCCTACTLLFYLSMRKSKWLTGRKPEKIPAAR